MSKFTRYEMRSETGTKSFVSALTMSEMELFMTRRYTVSSSTSGFFGVPVLKESGASDSSYSRRTVSGPSTTFRLPVLFTTLMA